MRIKKKIIMVIALGIFFLAQIAPAFAQARYGTKKSRPLETSGVFTDKDGKTMDYGVWIYGISIFADQANSYMGTYDCDTADELNASTIYPRDEVGEATQYDTATNMYLTPEYYSDGVGAIIFTGVGSVLYGPEPT